MSRVVNFSKWLLESNEPNKTPGLSKSVINWLDRCSSKTWSINASTGKIDVDGDFISRSNNSLGLRGVNFGVIKGYFDCYNNNLTSLEGAPQEVGKGFDCSYNELTSLEGAPKKVNGYFICSVNKLTSLEGAPQVVGGDFYCNGNELTSLEGAPQVVGGGFYCDEFSTDEWNMKEWLKILGDGASLILTILPEAEIDLWMTKHPLDIALLDALPEIKKRVIQRTGIKDLSTLSRNLRGGII